MPHSGKHHRDATLIGGRDDLVIAHRTAGLDDRDGAGIDEGVQAIAALARCQLSVHEYSALQIKQSVVGYGHATKDQIRQMMQRLLELPGLPSSDAADALACALTHLQTAPFDARLRAVGATRGRASFRRR